MGGLHFQQVVFDPLHHFLQALKPSGTEYQLCSSLGEVNGRCFSDPTTCSGNDHYFISDSRHEWNYAISVTSSPWPKRRMFRAPRRNFTCSGRASAAGSTTSKTKSVFPC